MLKQERVFINVARVYRARCEKCACAYTYTHTHTHACVYPALSSSSSVSGSSSIELRISDEANCENRRFVCICVLTQCQRAKSSLLRVCVCDMGCNICPNLLYPTHILMLHLIYSCKMPFRMANT